MSVLDRVSALKEKHAALEAMIDELLRHPCADSSELAELKRKKLRIKDELARLVEV